MRRHRALALLLGALVLGAPDPVEAREGFYRVVDRWVLRGSLHDQPGMGLPNDLLVCSATRNNDMGRAIGHSVIARAVPTSTQGFDAQVISYRLSIQVDMPDRRDVEVDLRIDRVRYAMPRGVIQDGVLQVTFTNAAQYTLIERALVEERDVSAGVAGHPAAMMVLPTKGFGGVGAAQDSCLRTLASLFQGSAAPSMESMVAP